MTEKDQIELATPPPLPGVALPVSRWRWWVHLLLIGGYFVPSLFLRRYHDYPALTKSASGLLIVCSIDLFFFGLVYALACYLSRATRDDLLLRWRPGPLLTIPLGLAYSLAIRVGTGVAAMMVFVLVIGAKVASPDEVKTFVESNRPNLKVLVDMPSLQHNPAYFWLTLTLVSMVMAGLREELWRGGTLAAMRALWPRAFGSKTGQLVAVAVIAIFFGSAHLHMGILAAAVAAVLGLFLGVIMVLHQSIWPAVLAHGFFDATTFALLPLLGQHLKLG